MKTDSFVLRHIGPSENEVNEMVRTIGVSSVDELINKTIPSDIRLANNLDLPKALSEFEYMSHIQELANKNNISVEDKSTGYIYVLKSNSEDDRIKTMANLFKIGFSSTSIEDRIKNAENEPTYLMAAVSLVSAYETYNINPHKLEQLLHKFFGHSCLNIDIQGTDGQIHRPREWFIAPINVIESSIELIISGAIVNYKYDSETERIVEV